MEETPQQRFTRQVEEAVIAYGVAWQEQDKKKISALFTREGAEYCERPYRQDGTYRGRDDIEAYWERQIIAKQKDIQFDAKLDEFICDHERMRALVKWEASFVNRLVYSYHPTFTKRVQFVQVAILTFEKDDTDPSKILIRRLEEYWHSVASSLKDKVGDDANDADAEANAAANAAGVKKTNNADSRVKRKKEARDKAAAAASDGAPLKEAWEATAAEDAKDIDVNKMAVIDIAPNGDNTNRDPTADINNLPLASLPLEGEGSTARVFVAPPTSFWVGGNPAAAASSQLLYYFEAVIERDMTVNDLEMDKISISIGLSRMEAIQGEETKRSIAAGGSVYSPDKKPRLWNGPFGKVTSSLSDCTAYAKNSKLDVDVGFRKADVLVDKAPRFGHFTSGNPDEPNDTTGSKVVVGFGWDATTQRCFLTRNGQFYASLPGALHAPECLSFRPVIIVSHFGGASNPAAFTCKYVDSPLSSIPSEDRTPFNFSAARLLHCAAPSTPPATENQYLSDEEVKGLIRVARWRNVLMQDMSQALEKLNKHGCEDDSCAQVLVAYALQLLMREGERKGKQSLKSWVRCAGKNAHDHLVALNAMLGGDEPVAKKK